MLQDLKYLDIRRAIDTLFVIYLALESGRYERSIRMVLLVVAETAFFIHFSDWSSVFLEFQAARSRSLEVNILDCSSVFRHLHLRTNLCAPDQ